MHQNKWTQEETDLLKKLSEVLSARDIGRKLGRTRDSVRHKIAQLHIPGFKPVYETIETVKQEQNRQEGKGKTPLSERFLPQMPKKKVRYATQLEWCPQCGAPVSDWTAHFERLGHRRPAA